MGIEKAKMEVGYCSVGGTVCSECFADYGIKYFIENNANSDECSYCGSCAPNTKACDFEDVAVHILESIKCEWGHPSNEGVSWESREGGWQGASVYDSYDLIYDVLAIEVENEAILSDLNSTIMLEQWCKKDPYFLDENDRLLYAWNSFSELVKHNSRYVFLERNDTASSYDEMNPIEILSALGNIIFRLGLVKILEKQEKIFRVRITDKDKTFSTAKQLGTPKKENAIFSNRMSPAGIPMFYGAFDIKTAIIETYEPEDTVTKHAVCGTFVPTKKLAVIDLSEKIEIPSLFDEKKREDRYSLKFLQNFIDDFVKPIHKVDKAHISYVPTQIVTEYFKHIYNQAEFGENIDGIIYPSSKSEGGRCIVIFADSSQCIEKTDDRNGNEILVLNNVTIKQI